VSSCLAHQLHYTLASTEGQVITWLVAFAAALAGRVRGWRLGRRRSSLFALRFLRECPQLPTPYPGFHPLPRGFSLIRLSDSLLPVACTVSSPHALHSLPHQASVKCCLRLALRYRPRGPFRELSMGVVGLFGHAPSLTVPLDAAQVGSLPSCKVMLSLLSTVL